MANDANRVTETQEKHKRNRILKVILNSTPFLYAFHSLYHYDLLLLQDSYFFHLPF